MLVEKITSRQNPLVKRFRRVRAMGERHHIFLEGVRLMEDAIGSNVHFESVAFTGDLEATERGAALIASLQSVQCRGALVSKQVMQAISDTQNPQGVAAIVSRPYLSLEELFASHPDLLVVADELQDPGNLGTIVRTAEAAGASGVITTRYTVDPFIDKAIRASMGSALRLPIVSGANRADVARLCSEHRIKLIASRASASPASGVIEDAARAERVKLCTEVDMTSAIAFVVGREATGVSTSALSDADELVHIPMAVGIESLNVASATAILLYEAARQRGFTFRAPGSKTSKAKSSKEKKT